MTNVVKHFKWEERGKKRIHQKPSSSEVTACFPWLEAEIEVVEPEVIVRRQCGEARSASSVRS